MIRSMTGYSRISSEEEGFVLTVSVKSTNHRFLDVQLRLPAGLESCEVALRRLIKDRIARGHVEVQAACEWRAAGEPQLDRRLLDAYVGAWRRLRDELGAASQLDVMALLRVPGMLEVGNDQLAAEELARVQEALLRVADQSLAQLNEMRAREGEALERDVRSRLERLRVLSDGVTDLAHDVPTLYRRRLDKRLEEIRGSAEVDPGRLAQEVAFLASRSDISEELTRFRSHLDQAAHLLDESSEVGKKLDFLLQEMNREANTLLSKTTDVPEVGLEIARQAIEMKTEIERLREQAQNIE